jgi:hypothetical protein
LILGCTAVVLHILDSKSRKEIVTRKLLNRTRNAITNENKVLKINRNLTNSIKQLEASNDIKKTQIKNLNGKLQKSNASVAVSLSAQKKVKFLEARIEEMKSHPTLEEKMVYRQKISALKKRERSELEAERRKRQEIRLQAKNQTNQYMLHPISQTPPEEPKNLTPLQKHQ